MYGLLAGPTEQATSSLSRFYRRHGIGVLSFPLRRRYTVFSCTQRTNPLRGYTPLPLSPSAFPVRFLLGLSRKEYDKNRIVPLINQKTLKGNSYRLHRLDVNSYSGMRLFLGIFFHRINQLHVIVQGKIRQAKKASTRTLKRSPHQVFSMPKKAHLICFPYNQGKKIGRHTGPLLAECFAWVRQSFLYRLFVEMPNDSRILYTHRYGLIAFYTP